MRCTHESQTSSRHTNCLLEEQLEAPQKSIDTPHLNPRNSFQLLLPWKTRSEFWGTLEGGTLCLHHLCTFTMHQGLDQSKPLVFEDGKGGRGKVR